MEYCDRLSSGDSPVTSASRSRERESLSTWRLRCVAVPFPISLRVVNWIKYLNCLDIQLDEVEDIIQEVFIAFWKHNKEFNNINAVKAFLYTSARNKCLNYLKHQSVLKKHQPALIYELESEQFFKSHIIEEEAFNQLYSEIHKLPESAQKIMILAIKGLKNNEIATELNISINTVKTQKKIAYAKLKGNLGPVLWAIVLSL